MKVYMARPHSPQHFLPSQASCLEREKKRKENKRDKRHKIGIFIIE
jgi:hypothetical protein